MDQRSALRILTPAVGAVVLLTGTGSVSYADAGATTATRAQTVRDTRAVTEWIERDAARLGTVDPAAPLDDLAPLRRAVGDATIVGLGESAHRVSEETALAYRDARAAENLRWWRAFSGDRVAYWAASGHTAVAPELTITAPPSPELRFATVGSYLRRWYGAGYRSIGFTFDHGSVGTDDGGAVAAPPPAADWFERPFGAVGHRQFALDLRAAAPVPVRRWLHAPVRTRGLVGGDPSGPHDSFMSGGTLAQWFDVIVHRQAVTAARSI